jgi:hypothetical protein
MFGDRSAHALVAQPEVEGQARCNAPVILEPGHDLPVPELRVEKLGRKLISSWSAQQHIRE